MTAEHPNAALFRQAMEAFGRGDFEQLPALLDEDVEWYTVGDTEPIRGREAVLASFSGRDFQIETTVHDVVANDDHTVGLLEAVGRRGDETLEYRTVEILHMRDGKVTQRWSFADDTEAVRRFFA